uniref:Uncharacterized protein n=1 Tax=Oryza barthii TaxID=65489 RepID=A0A0D3G8R3_9ORYZ
MYSNRFAGFRGPRRPDRPAARGTASPCFSVAAAPLRRSWRRWPPRGGAGGGRRRRNAGEKRAAEPSIEAPPPSSKYYALCVAGGGRTWLRPWKAPGVDVCCANPGGRILLRRAGAPRAAGSRLVGKRKIGQDYSSRLMLHWLFIWLNFA